MSRSLQALQIAQYMKPAYILFTGRGIRSCHIHTVKIVQLHNELYRVEEPGPLLHGLRFQDFESQTPPVSGVTLKSPSARDQDTVVAWIGGENSTKESGNISAIVSPA